MRSFNGAPTATSSGARMTWIVITPAGDTERTFLNISTLTGSVMEPFTITRKRRQKEAS